MFSSSNCWSRPFVCIYLNFPYSLHVRTGRGGWKYPSAGAVSFSSTLLESNFRHEISAIPYTHVLGSCGCLQHLSAKNTVPPKTSAGFQIWPSIVVSNQRTVSRWLTSPLCRGGKYIRYKAKAAIDDIDLKARPTLHPSAKALSYTVNCIQ